MYRKSEPDLLKKCNLKIVAVKNGKAAGACSAALGTCKELEAMGYDERM